MLEKSKKLKEEKILLIFLGIDKVIQNVGATELGKILVDLESTKNVNVILADSLTKIKGHEFEEWFKNYNSGDSGIWIGNGVDGQYLISITANRRDIANNCGDSYAHIIEKGSAKVVKLVRMKEETEDE